jgi:hypothetical protein
MIEMEVRVDNNVDLCRIAVERGEARADLLARPETEREQAGDPRPDACLGIELAVSNSARPFGCSIR